MGELFKKSKGNCEKEKVKNVMKYLKKSHKEEYDVNIVNANTADTPSFICIAVNTPIVDNKGISHIIEHLIRRELVCNLRVNGVENIFHREITFPEWTMYYLELPKRRRKKAIKIFVETLFDARYVFDKMIIDKEVFSTGLGGVCRGRVYNEIQARFSSRLNLIEKNILSKLCDENPDKYNICGDVNQIVNVCRDDILEYYKQTYRITNARFFSDSRKISNLLQDSLSEEIECTVNCTRKGTNKQKDYRVLLDRDVYEVGTCSISYVIGADNRNRILWQIASVNELIKKKKCSLQKFIKLNGYGEYVEVIFRDNICDPFWTFVIYNAKMDLETIRVALEAYIVGLIKDNYCESKLFLQRKVLKDLTSYEKIYLRCQNNGELAYAEDNISLNKVLEMQLGSFLDSFVFDKNIECGLKENVISDNEKKQDYERNDGTENVFAFGISINCFERVFIAGVLKIYFMDLGNIKPEFGDGYIKNIQVRNINANANVLNLMVQVSCVIYNKNMNERNNVIDTIIDRIICIDEDLLQMCIMKFVHNVDKNVAHLITGVVGWNAMSGMSNYYTFLDGICGLSFFDFVMGFANNGMSELVDICKKSLKTTDIRENLVEKIDDESRLNLLTKEVTNKRKAYQFNVSTASLGVGCKVNKIAENMGTYLCVVNYINQLIMEDIVQHCMGTYSAFCQISDNNTILFTVSGCSAVKDVIDLFNELEVIFQTKMVSFRTISQSHAKMKEDIRRLNKFYLFSESKQREIWKQIRRFERMSKKKKIECIINEVTEIAKELRMASYTLLANETIILECNGFFDEVYVI